ncbi:MAG TPA: hypothetical protein VGJ00_03065 [Rhabdochlamydiaceae bacterium]|jgi:hypothetical protein
MKANEKKRRQNTIETTLKMQKSKRENETKKKAMKIRNADAKFECDETSLKGTA